MMAQSQEPVHPAQCLNRGCFYDEPVRSLEEKDSVQCNYPVFETGFSELEEVLFRFQAGSVVNRAVYSMDERKQRRMVSNRESARRSRLRKKRLLKNLAMELNRLKVQNREFRDRFNAAVCLNQMVRRENDQLKAESLVLWTRLGNLSQILLGRQLMLNQ